MSSQLDGQIKYDLAIMGLESSVSPEKLKLKYFELAKIYHPDRVKSSLKNVEMKKDHPQVKEMERKFHELQEAYD